jgi:hypothetical protein
MPVVIKSRCRGPTSRNSGSTESGQGILEYILILTFALTTTVLMARFMGSGLDRGVLLFGGQLEKDLKTGRTPASGWKN